MIDSQVFSQANGGDSYTDLTSLQSIRTLGLSDKNSALGEISKNFEAMLVRMMLKSMRDANEMFGEGNPLSSKESKFYQGMFDDQLAVSLSKNNSIGLADIMERQLLQNYGDKDIPAKLEQIESTENSSTNSLQQLLNRRRISVTPSMPMIKELGDVKDKGQRSDSFSFDGTVDGFVKQLYSMAKQAAATLGIDTDVLLSQAALETGWGKKISLDDEGNSSFNLFNIKADKSWQGETVTVPTLEVYNGMAVREFSAFRSYQSPQQSFNDYISFIANSPRYEQALGEADPKAYIKKISEAGYATDPNYTEKIMSIINSDSMKQATNKYKQMTAEG